MDLTLNVHVVQ